jgi:hypothetical protein
MGVDVDCGLMEGNGAVTAYSPGCSTYHGDRINLVDQDIAADRGVEHRATWKRIVRRDQEFDLSISGRMRPRPCYFDCTGLAVECYDAARFADYLRQKHRHIADPTADVEHPHPRSDAAFPD